MTLSEELRELDRAVVNLKKVIAREINAHPFWPTVYVVIGAIGWVWFWFNP
ncbi:hypothetical protein LCGC14_0789750 [marine sediment metagenome]|uniref:Uncharacterized protein n=1 Tax=marine sediment metagenome TaxID=412755 RepID=A0A0F9PX93_9ZZZZ